MLPADKLKTMHCAVCFSVCVFMLQESKYCLYIPFNHTEVLLHRLWSVLFFLACSVFLPLVLSAFVSSVSLLFTLIILYTNICLITSAVIYK
jgi:hypothetical protein